MPRHVALLRGINVGGRNLIRMPALAAAFEAEGFAEVSTYIQSGNVIFTAPRAASAALTERVEAMLADAFDYVPTVIVRDRSQMRSVVEQAPRGFGSEPDRFRYNVIFLKAPVTAATCRIVGPTRDWRDIETSCGSGLAEIRDGVRARDARGVAPLARAPDGARGACKLQSPAVTKLETAA